jgi:hypothetical protein
MLQIQVILMEIFSKAVKTHFEQWTNIAHKEPLKLSNQGALSASISFPAYLY